MIGKLTGTVDDVATDSALIDVGGVGYTIFGSTRTLAQLARHAQAGSTVSLHIETHVREDHIHLFGFVERAERDWFRLLTTVQGVGARVALAILGVLTPAELGTAIAAQDKAAVGRANGVGPKLAGRIVSELKEKAGHIALGPVAAQLAGDAAPAPENAAFADAVSALVNLGYRRSEDHLSFRDGFGQDALIRAGLKDLSAA